MSPNATVTFLHRYTIPALSATPNLVAALLGSITPDQLDARPDAERFTLREVVAHLADWESVWMDRVRVIRSEDAPALTALDPAQLAADNDYAHTDFAAQREKFRAGRAALVAVLQAVPDADWSRTARHSLLGDITLADIAHFVWGHDGYHLEQIAQYLKRL